MDFPSQKNKPCCTGASSDLAKRYSFDDRQKNADLAAKPLIEHFCRTGMAGRAFL